ncbi:amylo-alpha-1,6-glucosidase [Acidiphilium sp. PA]|uniref:amylo-alpha-1,6-glucosidase n=1 Tax=Acidiphilium sp. PA TaxID=2871705 RepID=UPI002243A383|nr:amylo-alpha-1,6-glucosidase [Acidiphilium sp. PA]MCW8306708.1 amylo-alpha-1,6-glucosidase [Acidiphilium sp. PA]
MTNPNPLGDQTFPVAADAIHAEDRPYTLKSDDCFAILGITGDMSAGSEGVYFHDTRHLSRLTVTLNGARPRLLSGAMSTDNATLVCDLAAAAPDGVTDMGDDANEISLRRETFLWHGTRHDALTLGNWSRTPQTLTIGIGFAADFADLFEVRGTKRARHGILEAPSTTAHCVTLACRGLDDVRRWTRLDFDPKPARIGVDEAQYNLTLAPGATARIAIAAQCGADDDQASIENYRAARKAAAHGRRALRRQAASVITGNALVNTALLRARDDLIMLTTATEHGPYPYAGVPWFSTAFGRDAIITALQVLWLAPDLARGVLSFLAANQATTTDASADAEPGKILHECRDGEMARLGEVPFRRYYGSVDATPLFVMLAGAYHARTGDTAFIRGIWPNIEAALGWIDGPGDEDGDGFVEYGRKTGHGLANQGWKDSRDSIFHADGTLATGPIALCEVQAYVYGAKNAAAGMAAALGDADRATSLASQAAGLRARFDAGFWDDERQFYVLALDGAKRPCRVLASNAGHALFTGIALPGRAEAVATRLMGPDFFSGWGIRTLARGQPRFNPMSYHNGSVWPHDNALIGLGLARYGYRASAARLFDAMLATSTWAERYRLPELFCGFPRKPNHAPTAYPVACAPQAWAAGTLPALLDACLGIMFDPASGRANVDRPVLPAGIDRLIIENLGLAGQKVALSFTRTQGGVIVG